MRSVRIGSRHDPVLPLLSNQAGAPMRVTERDRHVVMKLAAARWLTTRQIAALCFCGLTAEMARRRIRLLREARYIRSVRANAMAEAMHALGPRGPELLNQKSAERTRLERTPPRNLLHAIGINDIRIAVAGVNSVKKDFSALFAKKD